MFHSITLYSLVVVMLAVLGCKTRIVAPISEDSSIVIPGGPVATTAFISSWKTDNTGTSNPNQITLPLEIDGTYNFTVDWGDGTQDTITTWNDPQTTHTYAQPGTYTLTIQGVLRGFRFNYEGDRSKLLNISQFGPLNLGNNGRYFAGANNLTITASDTLDLSGTTHLDEAFSECESLTTAPSMANWNVSEVTNMACMFCWASSFNQDISAWDVSRVTDMNYMFSAASNFNQPIGSWDTSNVTDMNGMFMNAVNFNQPIGDWNTGKVQDITNMFLGATTFNQPIGNWNVEKVARMGAMFANAISFNQPLGSWNTSNVWDLYGMFSGATAFNQPIGNWNVGNVTIMGSLFAGATAFNQDLSTWNTSKVADMTFLFANASSFSQAIDTWNFSSVINMTFMFQNSSLSRAHYDALLIALSNQTVFSGMSFDAGSSKFSANSAAVVAARNYLVDTLGWTITDGSGVFECAGSCFEGAQALPIGTETTGPDASTLSLQYANGSSGFKIWKEKNGNRILNASGLVANGWQKALNRAGTAFAGDLTNSLVISQIEGRVCPPNVFLNHDNMMATERCLYYDSGNSAQRLDAAHPDNGGAAENMEGEDWLREWDRSATGNGTGSSYFEGNIKTCADKGMRLPVAYEAQVEPPMENQMDLVPADASPTWANATGVPLVNGQETRTATAQPQLTSGYITWYASSGYKIKAWDGTNLYQWSVAAVRCVLPNSAP